MRNLWKDILNIKLIYSAASGKATAKFTRVKAVTQLLLGQR